LAPVQLGAEGPLVGLALGALVDHGAARARRLAGVVVALDEVLADLGPDELQQEAHVPQHGVVAQHRVARLRVVAPAQQRERAERAQRHHQPPPQRSSAMALSSVNRAHSAQVV
jgi:hypothetical protein